MAIGLGAGFLLHRFVPAIDVGMGTLIGVVTLWMLSVAQPDFDSGGSPTAATTSNGLTPRGQRAPG